MCQIIRELFRGCVMLATCVLAAHYSSSSAQTAWTTEGMVASCLAVCGVGHEGVAISEMTNPDTCLGFLKGASDALRWSGKIPDGTSGAQCIATFLSDRTATRPGDDKSLQSACRYAMWAKQRPGSFQGPAVQSVMLWMKATDCKDGG